jgi:hypothetical protein
MNDVFHEYLDDFVVFNIDDIFIFSKNMIDHECHQFKVEFLGYIFLEMPFTRTFIWFKPLWIGLPQLLFGMFNVFFDSPVSIGNSLCIIPQQ